MTTDNKTFVLDILPDPGDAVVVVKYNANSVTDVAGNPNEDTRTVAYLDLIPRAEVEQITLTPTAPTRVGGGDEITVTLTPPTDNS